MLDCTGNIFWSSWREKQNVALLSISNTRNQYRNHRWQHGELHLFAVVCCNHMLMYSNHKETRRTTIWPGHHDLANYWLIITDSYLWVSFKFKCLKRPLVSYMKLHIQNLLMPIQLELTSCDINVVIWNYFKTSILPTISITTISY